MNTTTGIIHGIADATPNQNPDPVNLREQLHAMADDFDRSIEHLATACTVQGILNGARLDSAVLALVPRIDELCIEAIDAIEQAIERHRKGHKTPTTSGEDERPDPGTLPEVGVEYQPCPACGHAAADQTYQLGKDSRKPVKGSPDCRYTYGNCRSCGAKMRIVFYCGD